jgi:hypothetical protein
VARTARVTPLREDGARGDPVEIDLDHVLWMEERAGGTVLFMNRWDGGEGSDAIINASLTVAESEREILWAVMP